MSRETAFPETTFPETTSRSRISRRPTRFAQILLASALVAVLLAVPASADPVKVGQSGPLIYWTPLVEHADQNLSITGPAGFCFEKRFEPYVDLKYDTRELRDGSYSWRIILTPELSSEVRQIIKDARLNDEKNVEEWLLAEGLIKQQIASGVFTIDRGELIVPDPNAPTDGPDELGEPNKLSVVEELGEVPLKALISGDVVRSSLCVGFDCPTTPTYGFDTIRLQENNLRINFDDTSIAASFPRNDWRLIANDSANGGQSRFSIDDATANRSVFTVEAGAPANALYVDSGGRVGSGTNNPAVEMHTVNGDTPTLRLDQSTASGFQAQSWDVAGNETSFFIRDVSSGSTLPFRIRPGAMSNSLVIDTDSDVGIGTLSPDTALHVETNGAELRVEDTNGTASSGSARTLFRLQNLGKLDFRLEDTNSGNVWKFENDPNGFFISLDGSGATEMALANNGDLVIDGTLTENSDVTRKENVEGVDPQHILSSVLELPITTWSYIDDPNAARHIGPMAQDFYAAFGYGGTSKGVQSRNLSSVALVAVQGLDAKVDDRMTSTERALHAELQKKQQHIDELEERLAALEALLLSSTD